MKSFKGHILEMAGTAQQGFQYEVNAVNALKPLGIVPKTFRPAGAGSDIPDIMLQKGGVQAGCELKITAASAGSLVMKYANGKWSIGNPNEKNDEKIFVIELAKEVGLLKQIEKTWSNEPYKFTSDASLKAEIAGLGKREIYSAELKRFPEIKGEIPATKIEEYYNKKKTYYVNVGTHGFYLLGSKNPLKLKDVPKFGTSAKAAYRARVQAKGGGAYQFTFEMSFSIPAGKRSPFNIAPTKGKSVQIVGLDVDWFKK